MSGKRYDSRDAFYGERPAHDRELSVEWDFGVWWTDSFGNRYRVSWVVNTGELYAVEHRTGIIEVLGVVPAVGDYPHGKGAGSEWAQFKEAQKIEEVLDGWAEAPQSLTWVRERIAAYEAEK